MELKTYHVVDFKNVMYRLFKSKFTLNFLSRFTYSGNWKSVFVSILVKNNL